MKPLLEVENLKTYFHTRDGVVRAVDGITLSVHPGETIGIVGESGSGKSVANYSLLGLVPSPPGKIESGTAFFEGVDLLSCSQKKLHELRGKVISIIFQDPMTALNPYLTIGNQLIEPLLVHEKCIKKSARNRAIEALEKVGIHDAAQRMNDYPHQFSGGMRQRVMIAMALITKPKLLIADEPTTALDVTVQAQILDLIKQAREDTGMAVILITHDLGVVAGVCDRVLVMYAGRIMESADICDLFDSPAHPYTRSLMSSMPSVHTKSDELYVIPGMPPDLSRKIHGCPFAPRCYMVGDDCWNVTPKLLEVSERHQAACIKVGQTERSSCVSTHE